MTSGKSHGATGVETAKRVIPMNLLWSYVYARSLDLRKFLNGLAADPIRFFADSGAHSARTLGVHIDVDQYAEWLLAHRDMCTIYANLDVIGAPDATRANQERLESYGLHPMPVFHTGEPFSVLEDYIQDGYTYIALGKLLGNSQKDLTPWIARCFEVAQDRAVFHGFGMTVWAQVKRWPWYSVDSSSWVAGVRYGSVRLFDNGRWKVIQLRDRQGVRDNLALLRSYGLTPRMLTKEGYDRLAVAGACAVAQYRASDWVAQRVGRVVLPPGKGYPPPDSPAAPKIIRLLDGPGDHARYLADTTVEKHKVHAEGLHQYLANTASTNHGWHANGLQLYIADSSTSWTPAAAVGVAKENGQ
ncbi:queuine tRNA-ribosyltransferase [Mycobacterium phage Cracklewink]|nr:queuine tRNA-ribosyltransferase [Mycobacterium phage Cracklewink]